MIAVISDIHGNYPALNAVMNKIESLKCDFIISLGDVVGYYSMINECINLLREKNVINILGNHDYYLLHGVPESLTSKTVRICIDYQQNIIEKTNYDWLNSSLDYFDNNILSARHAGWRDFREERFDNFDFRLTEKYPQKFFISGHSHKQIIQKFKDYEYCNPGSVGQPRDGDPKAAFAIWDGKFSLYRVKYDIDAICNDMKQHHFGEWIYKGLYIGKGI